MSASAVNGPSDNALDRQEQSGSRARVSKIEDNLVVAEL
jgi:hypothetical protein